MANLNDVIQLIKELSSKDKKKLLKIVGNELTANSKSLKAFLTEERFKQSIQIKGGKGKVGNYHIQHINSYHSILDTFIGRFKGVSSKYLGNYIVWNNIVKYAHERVDEKADIMFGYSVSYLMKERNCDVPIRPAFPTI